MDGREIAHTDLAQFEDWLSPTEAARLSRFIRHERRRQYLLGRTLLRLAISEMTGVPTAAISTIDRPGSGPGLILPEGVAHPGFSLSHSRHWIACAVSFGCMVGVDIEVIDPQRDIVALAEAAFHPDECAWLQGQGNEERIAAFYRMWTVKEALCKLSSFAGNDGGLPSTVNSEGELQTHGRGWFSFMLEQPGLSVCVCTDQQTSAIARNEVPQLAQMVCGVEA